MSNKSFRNRISEGHPRPDFARPDWMGLNGEWEFALDRRGVGEQAQWYNREGFPYRINVPFPVESELSGIGLKKPPKWVWYMKRFDVPSRWKGRGVRLKFGAVDYRARVWLNSSYLGEHTGGYTPFEFDATHLVKHEDNKLVVQVCDPRTLYQVRGKQTFLRKSFNIFYTTVTGIWQPVWMEATGPSRIDRLAVNADLDGDVSVAYRIDGRSGKEKLELKVYDPSGNEMLSRSVKTDGKKEGAVEFNVAPALAWSPGDPNLYPFHMKLTGADGKTLDEVRSYFGLRKIETRDGSFFINEEPFYHRFLLNQGYFPDGIYRPGDPDMWRRDIHDVLDMGFNGVRIHQKIEDPVFLYWCDVLGLPVWAEMPSYVLPKTRCHESFRDQWREAMARDINHPCIIAWVPFNEKWGIQDVWINRRRRRFFMDVVDQTRQTDPSRPVVANSGWENKNSDILDLHSYAYSIDMFERVMDGIGTEEGRAFSVRKSMLMGGGNGWPPLQKPLLGPKEKYRGQPIIVSEYGGFGFYPSKNKNLMENFRDYTLAIAKRPHIEGFAYTQQYDTEQERNGLLTYERKPKLNIEEIRRINKEVEKIVSTR